jgi:hypothetical protein
LKSPPPWTASVSMEQLVKNAVSLLDAESQEMLANTEIHIVPLPSIEQVMDEVDPRQVIFAHGIAPKTKSFLHLWVYVLNFDHAGVLPMAPESDLAALIQDELRFNHR